MSGFRVFQIKGSPLWAITAGYYSPKLNAAVRTVPGIRWENKLHVGYVDAIEQVVARLREMNLKSEDAPTNKRKWPHNLPVSYEGAREYQKEGIDFLVNQAGSGALLADEMGIGKSFQTVKAVRAFRRKTIIVCENHVRGVWEREPELDDKGGELARWWPKAKVFKPYGLKTTVISDDYDVVVIHYDIVYAWVEVLLAWAARGLTIVFDEAQMLLSQTSRRSEACRKLARSAQGRIALTGTPPVDKISDFYNVIDTISPGRFGAPTSLDGKESSFFAYGIRYADGKQVEVDGPEKTKKLVWDFKGRSNTKELRQRLDWFMLRRTKREVLKELPALQRQVVDVEVPAKHRIAMNARLVGDKKQMRSALDSAADGKFKSVVELVRSHLESGHKVVVGTYRRAVCEKFADALIETAPTQFVHGGMPVTRRNKVIAEMRKVEGPCCLVANIDATATGIDLTFAGIGVVAEFLWEPKKHVQWEARLHRFGASTSEPVLIQYVVARGTGDELILQAVINKLDNFLDLVETDEGDGLKETLVGEKDEGLSRLAAALKKMGKRAS